METNYDKLSFGLTIENNPMCQSVCHNYGIVSGCDEGCPDLLDGKCENPLDAIEVCDVTSEERTEILGKYPNALDKSP